MLNPDLRKKILKVAGRKLKYKFFRSNGVRLPSELVPPANLELYHQSIKEIESDDFSEPEEESNNSPEPQPIFYVDVIQKLVFNRRNNGILGPLTVTFEEEVDEDWWGFRADGEHDNEDEGTLNLDPAIIGPALHERHVWTGITRIRLLPVLNPHTFEPSAAEYRFELVRDGVHGHQRMVITLPRPFITHIEPDIATVIRDMQERLHLRLAVVENGVYEFSV
jgi:hypothetical protein